MSFEIFLLESHPISDIRGDEGMKYFCFNLIRYQRGGSPTTAPEQPRLDSQQPASPTKRQPAKGKRRGGGEGIGKGRNKCGRGWGNGKRNLVQVPPLPL